MPEFLPIIDGRNSGKYSLYEVSCLSIQKYRRIKEMREDRDWTQQYVADLLHINRRTYGAYENGVNMIPVDILIQLSCIYETSVDYLLGLTNNKMRNH
ncbi:MAG: helix-turn-helix transcriptional regulator [Clostridiales bacterium]|nr:helix-turn-helix transcriptional regulator [Clostridiales bacterium]